MTIKENDHQPASRVLALVRSEHWAITRAGMAQIEAIASQENVITKEVLAKIEARKEAVAAKRAARMDGTDGVVKREGGVAVLEVSGPIFPYANLFTQISGATSVEMLALDFGAVMADRSISSVVMCFDSPGGSVAGINEFANQVFAARGQGKRIIAYVPVAACSAAYWIASACDEIVIDATAELGSIGAKVGQPKPPKPEDSKNVTVTSRRAPKKVLDPGTEAGQASLQAAADAIESVMVASIARNRGMSEEAVTKAEGEVVFGQDAVDAGLADRLGSFEGLISELGGAPQGGAPLPGSKHLLKQTKEAAMYSKELKAQIGLTETATDAEVTARLTELQGAAARLPQLESDLKTANISHAKAAAKVTVDGWEKDGILSGNATAEAHKIYAALSVGEPVKPEQFSAFVLALPKIDTSRLGENLKPKKIEALPSDIGEVTLDDLKREATSADSARRVKAALVVRQAANPKFTRMDLQRELSAAN